MHDNKSLKITLSVMLLLMVVIFVMYYFLFQDIRYKNQNYQSILRDLSFQNDKQNYLASKQKAIDSVSAETSRVEEIIVSKDGDVAFIENLESMARENGLSIEISSLSLDNKLDLASSSISVLNIKAKTAGTWLGNYIFLSRLESMPFKTKINAINLSNISNDEISGLDRATVAGGVWHGVFDIDVLKYK